ncbi:hypothetical protein CMV_009720, partial [Castanea mollissima]
MLTEHIVQITDHRCRLIFGRSFSRILSPVHIGLHCVQDNPADRPTMATIVLTLNSDFVTLPLPQRP